MKIIGKPISRKEALKIAKEIIEEAERKRAAYNEQESKYGIQYDVEEEKYVKTSNYSTANI